MDSNPSEPKQQRPSDDSHVGPSRRTVLAAERTWLAWFRTGIGVSAAAIGVGAVLPKLTDSSSWGFVALGAGYAALAVAMFVEGWRRQRDIYKAIAVNDDVPTGIHAIAALTVSGGVLALATLALLFSEI